MSRDVTLCCVSSSDEKVDARARLCVCASVRCCFFVSIFFIGLLVPVFLREFVGRWKDKYKHVHRYTDICVYVFVMESHTQIHIYMYMYVIPVQTHARAHTHYVCVCDQIVQ